MERLDEGYILPPDLDLEGGEFQSLEDFESLDSLTDEDDLEYECDICGTPMNYEYGKFVCPNCGYVKYV